MEIQPQIINRRIEEVNNQQPVIEEAQKKRLEINHQKSLKLNTTSNEKSNIENLRESKKLIENKLGSDISKNEIVT